MELSDNTYIERLLRRLQIRLSADQYPLHEQFARFFWARTLEEDLTERDVADDSGATIEALRRLRGRQPDEVIIDLINPMSARDGWQSKHTVVLMAAPNMPFMVDSVLIALSHGDLVTHHLNNVVLGVDRNDQGQVSDLTMAFDHPQRELVLYAEIDRLEDEALQELQHDLTSVCAELQAAVQDFAPMKARTEEIVQGLRNQPPPLDAAEIAEAIAFLEWLLANHFTFLGYREFAYGDGYVRQTGQALGIQRIRNRATTRRLDAQPQRTQDFLMASSLLSFSKSGTRSRVHRHAYPDYIGIKQFDPSGKVIGEIGLLGLYTSRVYREFPENIPVIRRKVANTILNSGLDPSGFDGKVLVQVLATYPRDELFQIGETELLDTAMVITDIHERRKVRVFPRYDAYGLFVNVLVYMPRDLFSTAVRLAVSDLLVKTFDAVDSDHDILLSESILVRVQFTLRIRPRTQLDVDRVELEQRISELIGDWSSELAELLLLRFGETMGRNLHVDYAQAFSAGYQERFAVRSAIDDITVIEQLHGGSALSTQFYRLPEDSEDVLRLKIYHLGTGLPLSDVVPKLENLGLRVVGEHPHTVRRANNAAVSVQDYELSFPVQLDLQKAGIDFNEAFVRIWRSEVEDDRFNRLILHAGLSWREVTVLRAYAQYMKQIRFGFSQFAISDALFQHQTIARDLVLYFVARFDPGARTDACPEIRARILAELEHVALLNEDRVLRRFLELMDASTRTNYFMKDSDGAERSCLAIKLAPGRISGMPQPVPQYEVFVSAPHLEGVHLRSGPISRGGLRWSDRREDFRTEVLGLVKAQVVKNAVIVPTGAKGGFVVKGEHTGEACYRDFIRSLLDITDNIVDGMVMAPAGVRAHDEQDPYLVVAADKGTATFSDIANEIAETYQFWLGDAFASGGSFGYDHKKMGITARGAWVSVQRHFAEIGIDVQNEEFTVLGIGDMGGDVFGNGMLLSPCIQLVAAFNHQHIFIDPQPETAAGFAERQRLFALPRSGWGDYDTELISAGGGVFPRSAKAIEITPQMQSRFAIDADSLAPDELIHHLLKSPVQLIWNGGIGTYVKATGESHDEVGDRANDHLRVNAAELQCAAFGEGGNLGVTQRGRIEFNLAGGAINTDAIDNSAGVDCSDHEVNIKIALGELVAREDMTRKQRNQLLESMTDSVADLVLQNNYNQARTISLTQQHSVTRGAQYARLITYLCEHAGLDPLQENLPGGDELADRYAVGHSLTRPEIAVLLAYAKSHIKNELMASNVSAEPLIRARLYGAFPALLVDDHAAALERHRLAAEIIATQLANEIVDCMGPAFVAEMVESGSHTVADVARAYVVVSTCFGFTDWFTEVREQGGAAATQLEILQEVVRLGRRATRWMLRHTNLNESLEQVVQRFQPVVAEMQGHRNGNVGEKGAAWAAAKEALLQAGVAPALAHKSAHAAELARLLPVVDVARQRDCPVDALIDVTTAIGHELQIDWLSYQLAQHAAESHWQSVERESLLDDLFTVQNLLGALVLKSAGGDVSTWLASNELLLQGWYAALRDLTHGGAVDFTVYSILARKLSDLGARLQSA